METIADSYTFHSDSKSDLFFLETVDGRKIENSEVRTWSDNLGRGFKMTPKAIHHWVPTLPITVTIVGRTAHPAPLLGFIRATYEVKGEVRFTPENGKFYVVRGQLGEAYSAVWIEEEVSGKLIGTKFETKR